MLLSNNEKQNILLDFPNIKLSYENIIHKKVYSDYYVAIPEGEKCFAWFSKYKNKNVCFILSLNLPLNLPLRKVEPNLKNVEPNLRKVEPNLKKVEPNFKNVEPNLKKVEPNYLSENNQILDIKIVNSCYNSTLCYDTILYGTYFNQLNNSYFSIEDFFYYKGKDISNIKWIDKLFLLNDLMKNNINQISYNNSFVVFGLPLMNTNFDELNKEINNLKYKINSIHFKMFDKNNTYFKYKYSYETILSSNTQPKSYNKNNIIKKESIFKIKPDIQNDIYHLYCNDKLTNNILYYDIAFIPDFKTSVLMNKLFRNIKENQNLDSLEESDDDEDFENENENKFVFLDKEYNMICLYNNKFKKWFPIKLALKNQQITNYCDLTI